MNSLPRLSEVEEHLIQLFVKRGNRPMTPREAFRTVALEFGLSSRQLSETAVVAGARRNTWQYRCEAVWRDLEQQGRIERRTLAAWALSKDVHKNSIMGPRGSDKLVSRYSRDAAGAIQGVRLKDS